MNGTEVFDSRGGRPVHGEAVLTRAFHLLQAFEGSRGFLGLADLAHRAGMPKTTALRIASQLVDVGALERRESGEFVVGLRLLEFATLAPRGHGLRAAALPYLEDLHQVTRQHVLLAVRDGSDAVLVERLSAHDATPVSKYRVGGRLPLSETGVGVALLAYAPEPIRSQAIEDTDAGSRPKLRQLMYEARSKGLLSVSIRNPIHDALEISTVAAPVLDGRGGTFGAISLVSPAGGPSLIGRRLALRTASLAIARALGGEQNRT